jgi:hypothetical protein
MSNRHGELAHGSDAVGMRQRALHLAILPRRVLSKAMAACAAKSLNKEICLSVNGCTCFRPRAIVPTISLSLSTGITKAVRRPEFTIVIQKASRRSPSSAVKSGMWVGILLAAPLFYEHWD